MFTRKSPWNVCLLIPAQVTGNIYSVLMALVNLQAIYIAAVYWFQPVSVPLCEQEMGSRGGSSPVNPCEHKTQATWKIHSALTSCAATSMRNFHKPHATSNHYSTVITNVSLATTSPRWEELCRLSLIDGFQTHRA